MHRYIDGMPEAWDVPSGAINTTQATELHSVVTGRQRLLSISEICDLSPSCVVVYRISPFSFATSKKREDDIVEVYIFAGKF